MNRSLGLALLFLFGAGPPAIGQDAKVFEVLAAPGDTSPMHTHPPLVVISLDKARLRVRTPDGSATIFDLNPAQVLWFENVEHSWELLSGQVHLFAVEVKAARGATAGR